MTKREVIRTVLNHQERGLQMGPAIDAAQKQLG